VRFVLAIAVMLASLLVASCSSVGHFVADNLPTWAAGLPEGTPPRPGEPGYDEYQKAVRGEAPRQPAGTAPAAAPSSTKAGSPGDVH
jgi:hypothetical protein